MSTSPTRSRAAWPRARARSWSWTPTQGIEAQTLANVYLALEDDLAIIPVINKIDLPSAEPETVAKEIEDVIGIPRDEVVLASAKEGIGTQRHPRGDRRSACRRPRATQTQPLRALIFDSNYDAYKGVIAYVRVVDGALKGGERMRHDADGQRRRDAGGRRLQPGPDRHEAADGGRGRLRRHRLQEREGLPGRRHGHAGRRARRRAAARLPARQADGLRRHLPGRGRRLSAAARRAGPAASSTTPRSSTSRRTRSRSASASAAASWACCTWRSSRSGWSASTTSTCSPPRPASSIR